MDQTERYKQQAEYKASDEKKARSAAALATRMKQNQCWRSMDTCTDPSGKSS
jgi:hypothetical protein